MGSFTRTVIRNYTKKLYKENTKEVKKRDRIPFIRYWRAMKKKFGIKPNGKWPTKYHFKKKKSGF